MQQSSNMGSTKVRNMKTPINDIYHCIQQARSMKRIDDRDKKISQAFTFLAGDREVGFLAFAIWRGRSNMLTYINDLKHRGPEVQNTPGASLAQT